jgi:hypothetical protein
MSKTSAKYSFTMKRNNYKKYNLAKWKWIDVFKDIDFLISHNDRKYIAKTSKKYNINRRTLIRKYQKYKRGILDAESLKKEHRGAHNKIFTYNEEKMMFQHIKNVYIDGQKFFDDKCLQKFAIKTWKTLYPKSTKIFKASNGWVYSFKKRWKLSTQTSNNSHIAKNPAKEEIIESFLNKCKEINETIDKEYIFNLDETNWKISNGQYKSIGIMGAENRKINCKYNTKASITAVLIITANGSFHKPYIIIKGKTQKTLDKINLNDNFKEKISENGWITTDIMLDILDDIKNICKKNKAALIMDTFNAHIDKKVKAKAKKLKIELVYVPVGQTSKLQPLDVSINGPIKTISKSLLKDCFVSDPDFVPNINHSINFLIQSCQKIKQETIKKSFEKACKIV